MRPTKMIVFATVAVFIVFASIIGANFAIGAVAMLVLKLTGFDLDAVLGGWAGVAVIVAVIYLTPTHWLSWNRKYYIEGEAIIDAPVQDIWDWMQIRERDDYFSATMRTIRAVPGTTDEFHMLMDDKLDAGEDGVPNHVHVRVLDEERYEYMAYHIVNIEEMPLFGKDHLMTEVLLDPHEDGVRVRYIETLSRVTLTGFLMLLFLNPARDAMASLKAQVEGAPDTSVLRNWFDGIGKNGEEPAEVKRAVAVGGVTALIVTTALCAGLMYMITNVALG